MPFDYLRVVFTGLLGYLAFNQVPDKFSIIGYTLIVLGGLYLIRNEGKRKGWRRETEELVESTKSQFD